MRLQRIIETLRGLGLALLMTLLVTSAAYAGPLDGIQTYLTGNVVTTASTLAVIGIGFYMLSMRCNWISIVIVCGGIWIICNPTTLETAFAGG